MLHKLSISLLLIALVATAKAQQVSKKGKPTLPVLWQWQYDSTAYNQGNTNTINIQQLVPSNEQKPTLGSMAEHAMNYNKWLNDHTLMRVGYRGTTVGLDFQF